MRKSEPIGYQLPMSIGRRSQPAPSRAETLPPETWEKIRRSISRGPRFTPTRQEKQLRTMLLEMRKCRVLIQQDEVDNMGRAHRLHLDRMFQLINQAAAIFDSMPEANRRRCPSYLVNAIGRVCECSIEDDVFDLGFSTFRGEDGSPSVIIGETIYRPGLPFSVTCKLVPSCPPDEMAAQAESVRSMLSTDESGCENSDPDA